MWTLQMFCSRQGITWLSALLIATITLTSGTTASNPLPAPSAADAPLPASDTSTAPTPSLVGLADPMASPEALSSPLDLSWDLTDPADPWALPLDVRGSSADTAERDFTAAVFEFAPRRPTHAGDAPWRRNMETATRQAQLAAQKGADLLVLAEYGISGARPPHGPRVVLLQLAAQLPQLSDRVVACGDSTQHEVVSGLSCLAQRYRLYLVANYAERQPCWPSDYGPCRPGDYGPSRSGDSGPCPPDGVRLYNTNMVFDRNGTLIQTYRKLHLFGTELQFLQRPRPRLAAFRTDFGAVIGLMICFDILFHTPAVEMADRGVRFFAFPTKWGDELPSLTALQMHSAWARGLGVTLLASGFHNTSIASIGSGIFTGGGALNYTYDYRSTDGELVTARVPNPGTSMSKSYTHQTTINKNKQTQLNELTRSDRNAVNQPADTYYPLQHYNLSGYASVLVTGESQSVCHGQFCCHLRPTAPGQPLATAANTAAYRLLAYTGHRYYAPRWSTEVCAAVLCADHTPASCNEFPASVGAQRLPPFQLSATFTNNTAVYPSVVQLHMRLAAGWDYDRDGRTVTVHDTAELLVAQLYGRNYAADTP